MSGQIARQESVGAAPTQSGIARAIVIKDGDLFFLSEPDGCVPIARSQGFGLYYHDCRFLNGYELRVAGQKPGVIESNAAGGYIATLKVRTAREHLVDICWSREISNKHLALFDTITLQNLTSEPVCFPLVLSFQSNFEDLFAVRGFPQNKRGTLHTPVWTDGILQFLYDGADAVLRELQVHFSPVPFATIGGTAHYQIDLALEGRQQFLISLLISESRERKIARPFSRPKLDCESGTTFYRDPSLQEETRICSDNSLFNRVMDCSLRDLDMLRTNLGTNSYFAAGVPWYVALFGRDSIITALQALAYDSQIAAQTICLLSDYQGKKVNEWRDEEPGKILHELRVGEMANLHEIPHTPYYGTIDATPLWLILVGRHAAWTGDLRIFNELRPNIEAALNWIEEYGDFDCDGYVEYQCKSEQGLINQGWKDSGDGIVNADGSLAVPPIALVEVQGYVYEAKIAMASLYRRTRDEKRATKLENDAQQLRERFNHDFWISDGFYALALQRDKRQAAVLSSNAGHALWSGIAHAEQARQIADHLLSPAMFTGWGIRTLSDAASRYNPLGYHLGTVWPHDNSLIGAGFKRYGFDQAAMRVLNGLLDAAAHFDAHRLPELFGGFAREDSGAPASYPIACKPQAWSAGAVPYLLTTTLGLEPEAFERRLRIVRPMLPTNVNRVAITQLRVGAASLDLLFERQPDGITANVTKVDGHLQIAIESS